MLLKRELFFKIDGATHQQVWRHTFGQPRGFDARCCRQNYLIIFQSIGIWANPLCRYIHDECYGVALDADGNYLIIGGWASFNFAHVLHISSFIGQGMNTTTRRQMLTAGAATPGWELPQKTLQNFPRKSSYPIILRFRISWWSHQVEILFSAESLETRRGTMRVIKKTIQLVVGDQISSTQRVLWPIHIKNRLRRIPHRDEKWRCDDLHRQWHGPWGWLPQTYQNLLILSVFLSS